MSYETARSGSEDLLTGRAYSASTRQGATKASGVIAPPESQPREFHTDRGEGGSGGGMPAAPQKKGRVGTC